MCMERYYEKDRDTGSRKSLYQVFTFRGGRDDPDYYVEVFYCNKCECEMGEYDDVCQIPHLEVDDEMMFCNKKCMIEYCKKWNEECDVEAEEGPEIHYEVMKIINNNNT